MNGLLAGVPSQRQEYNEINAMNRKIASCAIIQVVIRRRRAPTSR
jgi:hypothetical protein